MRYLAALLVGGFGVLAGLAPAQEVGSLEWFRKAWVEADNWIPEEPLLIEFEIHYRSRTSTAELAEIRREVEGKPDHPFRPYLPMLEFDAAQPETSIRHRYWIAGRVWRHAVEVPPDHYEDNRDAAEGPRESWWTTGDSLTIYETERPPHLRDLSNARHEMRDRLQLFFHNGFFGTQTPLQYEPVSSSLSKGGGWSGAVETDDGAWRIEFSGTLSDAGDEILIDRKRVVKAPWQPQAFDGFDVLEWGQFESIDRPVPVRVAWREARPPEIEMREPFPTIVLTRVEPVERKQVLQLASVPVDSREDPIRGAIKMAQIHDFRPSQMQSTRQTESGVVRRPLAGPLPPPQSSSWRSMGWLVGGLVVGGLLLLYWRRRGQLWS